MINIVIDPYDIYSGGMPDIIVEDEQQYIDSRAKIREAIQRRANLTVVVRDNRLARWYESLKDYSDGVVRVSSTSPKSVLAEKLDLSRSLAMSFPLDDSQIMELNLIEKAVTLPPRSPIATQGDVENWVLSVCIDRCWSDSNATMTHLSKLVSFFLSGNADLASERRLQELVRRRKSKWVDSGLGDVYDWLLEEPVGHSFLVYCLQTMKDYEDSMRQRILAEIARRKSFALITDKIAQMPFCECSDKIPNKLEFSNLVEIKWKNTLRDRLRYGLSETKGTDKAEVRQERFERIVREAVVRMSGWLVGELNALVTIVQENPLYFSKGLFNLLCGKFHLFPGKIKELEDLIPPDTPSLPQKAWDWLRISEWLIRQYMPYAKWSLRHIENDRILEERAEAYGDWLYDNYPRMKNDLTPLNYGTWSVIRNYLDDGYQILWIIIDNLCWFYVEHVQTAFRENGFYLTAASVTGQLSMLPSETKISKTALVAGKLPCQVDPSCFQKYQELFEQRCKEIGIESYKAIPDQELRLGNLGTQRVTCCIINKLDISSHQGFFDFEDDVRGLLSNIAKYLKRFIPPQASLKKLRILVSTDHGSCKIPNYVKGCAAPKVAVLDEQHRRFAYIDSMEDLSNSSYFLDKDRFGLTQNMVILRGYGFLGSKRPKGLVHGGMTPEETFIPLLEFGLQPLEVKEIKCLHTGQPIHLGPKKQKVELLVRNPNKTKISDVHIFIPSHSVEISVNDIPATDETAVTVEIALPKQETFANKENVVTLKGYYTFDYLGERKSGEVKVDVSIRRIIDVSKTEERLLEF